MNQIITINNKYVPSELQRYHLEIQSDRRQVIRDKVHGMHTSKGCNKTIF